MKLIKEIGSQIEKIEKDKKQLCRFGVLMATIGLALAFFFWRQEAVIRAYIFLFLAFFFAAGIFRPFLLFYLYKAWLGLSLILGYFISRLILFVLYYSLITPVGIVLRLVKGDVLRRKIDKNAASYWVTHEAAASRQKGLEQQF